MAITFDGAARIIRLDGALTLSIPDLYTASVDWFNEAANLRFLPIFSIVADPPLVPVFATLINGWRIEPLGLADTYTVTVTQGFVSALGGGDPFKEVASGVEPRVRFQDPVAAIGYADSNFQAPDVFDANIVSVNAVPVDGDGTDANPFGPV